MLYIHQAVCITHQCNYAQGDLTALRPSTDNRLYALEPKYQIPLGQLRRMGKAVRMGVGAGLHLLLQHPVNGIIVATSNGGIEDSIQFLNQITEYDEGRLTPTNFVQSTYNAIAGVMGMITRNHGYNITHVHLGLAFENALLDAALMLADNPTHTYLVGGVDEISARNHRMEYMGGWYKTEPVSNTDMFATNTPGTLPGEGAGMFTVSANPQGACAQLVAMQLVNGDNLNVVKEQMQQFIAEHLPTGQQIDLLLSGNNADARHTPYSNACEEAIGPVPVARFKQVTGEYQTVSAAALWLATELIKTQQVPAYLLKTEQGPNKVKWVLVYNHYKGIQHSFMLLKQV